MPIAIRGAVPSIQPFRYVHSGTPESRSRSKDSAVKHSGAGMPPRRLVVAFLGLWFTLGAVVFVASVRTMLGALSGAVHGPPHVHIALLAGIEALAAALFLVPRTVRIGGVGLLLTFAVALLAHALAGEFQMILVLYAAATIFVMVHGPVPWSWVRGRASAI